MFLFHPIFLSTIKYFAVALNRNGVNVLGIGSDPYEQLDPLLQASLTEYYFVHDMENYEALLRACGYFTHKYGKIDFIESHNEHWLESDAKLRSDFNVSGYKIRDMNRIKKKSEMKKVYIKAGIPVARGQVVRDLAAARSFIRQVGYPVIAKPDIGVGAAATYKINNLNELKAFFASKSLEDYIMEEFITGEIQTYDGLVDKDGEVVFQNSFQYGSGVLEIVNDGLDTFFYVQREIPEDLVEMGKLTLKIFNVKNRFFHFEYFRTAAGQLIALEVNVRPPGGPAIDLFNYANDIDIFERYARTIAGQPLEALPPAAYYCAYIGVKLNHQRQHSLEDVLTKYSHHIVAHGPIPEVLVSAMGNYHYILRAKNLQEMLTASQFILDRTDVTEVS